jgi:hypothetical protein
MTRRKPLDKDLYEAVVEEAKARRPNASPKSTGKPAGKKSFYERGVPVGARRDRYVLVADYKSIFHIFEEDGEWVARVCVAGKDARGPEYARGATPQRAASRTLARYEAAALIQASRRDRVGP